MSIFIFMVVPGNASSGSSPSWVDSLQQTLIPLRRFFAKEEATRVFICKSGNLARTGDLFRGASNAEKSAAVFFDDETGATGGAAAEERTGRATTFARGLTDNERHASLANAYRLVGTHGRPGRAWEEEEYEPPLPLMVSVSLPLMVSVALIVVCTFSTNDKGPQTTVLSPVVVIFNMVS